MNMHMFNLHVSGSIAAEMFHTLNRIEPNNLRIYMQQVTQFMDIPLLYSVVRYYNSCTKYVEIRYVLSSD